MAPREMAEAEIEVICCMIHIYTSSHAVCSCLSLWMGVFLLSADGNFLPDVSKTI